MSREYVMVYGLTVLVAGLGTLLAYYHGFAKGVKQEACKACGHSFIQHRFAREKGRVNMACDWCCCYRGVPEAVMFPEDNVKDEYDQWLDEYKAQPEYECNTCEVAVGNTCICYAVYTPEEMNAMRAKSLGIEVTNELNDNTT